MSTRIYKFKQLPKPGTFNGRQPSAVLTVIRNLKGNFTVKQVSDACDANGYFAAAGTLASVAWHLNQLLKADVVEISK
jgi:hypothetical protein